MVDPDRRPTAQEIEELIDLVRRDPGSPAFIDLGEAYLALGRPRDAAQVATLGLDASPDSLEGRVMLARAFASLHQWKEAQGELLRVVKVDRSNRTGFALLGEVLLRRTDFERAVPVLQHAQNLDPTSPQILAMLKRARSGQALEAPPPIPVPVPPRGETDNSGQILHSPVKSSQRPTAAPPSRSQPAPRPPPMAPPMPVQIEPMHELRGDPTDAQPPPPMFPGDPGPAYAPPPPQRMPKQTAPPPMSVEGVRPRVISAAKPQNAAAASLRQSAAVGENYLNDLLTGGLLEVAGVRVPDNEFDLRPDRRWGRSTRRAFIFLFVVLILGIGGGGTWYWWSEKQKAEAVARLQKEAKQSIGNGDFAGLEASLKKLGEAITKDERNLITFAYYAETTGLESLLYGTETQRVDESLKYSKDIKPGEPGSREMMIGKVALELSRLYELPTPAPVLADVNKQLDDFLQKSPTDKWARWLKGRAQLVAGERKGARAVFKTAAEDSSSTATDGLVVAMIDEADLLVDDGQLDDALKLYEEANKRSKDHPLVVLGRSLARAESSVDVDEAIGDLNDKFIDSKTPPRVTAYRALALALAELGTEDYSKGAEALKKATNEGGMKDSNRKPVDEPRFWSRIAWAQYTRSNLEATAKARAVVCVDMGNTINPVTTLCESHGKRPEDDPTVELVDAGLLLAAGHPDDALTLASRIEGVRPRLLRTYAQLDLGRADKALLEAEEVLKRAPQNLEAQILREEARMISNEKERADAATALDGLSRKVKSKLGRHALGMAYLAINDTKNAQDSLDKALEQVSEDSPNPLAYRTHTALATLALAANDLPGATKHLDEALKLNSGYLPTRALKARQLLRTGDPEGALKYLGQVITESTTLAPEIQLTWAEARITYKGSTQADKDKAKEIIVGLKDKLPPSIPLTELSRIAALIDPKLPKELQLPDPPTTAEVPGPGAKPVIVPSPHHHHH